MSNTYHVIYFMDKLEISGLYNMSGPQRAEDIPDYVDNIFKSDDRIEMLVTQTRDSAIVYRKQND